MQTRNLYLYWIGPEYKLISILRNLIYLHSTNGKGYNVVLITDQNIRDYINDIPEYFSKLCPAHQADFVRVNVICDYGGLWMDSDTLVLDTLDSLFDLIDNKNGFFIKQNNDILWNGIFGSKKQTPLMFEWKKQMMAVLDEKKGMIDWCDIGNNMLRDMFKTNSELYNNYEIFNGLNNMYPVNYPSCVTEFINKPYENYKKIVREYQPLIVLVNSVYKSLNNKTTDEILKSNMPINYFINKSIENKSRITQTDTKSIENKAIISGTDTKSIENKSRITQTDNKTIFENIYKNKIWNNGNNNIPLSGPGSSIQNTIGTTKLLNDFVYNNNCTSVLDLGCGDLTWISNTRLFNDNSIKYTGIDVVESLIDNNSRRYPEKSFFCKDITKNSDFEFASLIIIRDVIFHLKNDEVLSIFDNIKNKFKFLLITSCKNKINTDIFDRWRFSEKNINNAPFNKSFDFIEKIEEPTFNRFVYIYAHDNFYTM